ncbi:Hypothetical_protein [Hexamita inflata]|uniref:Hypothetical_protein n=1 Tax=Hexamita inflata TaxID=28002 RepID=A0AA86PNB5_9EUKA|nr:Hypothetical protein HINF_LOCUS28028 [Hexamita inflata]
MHADYRKQVDLMVKTQQALNQFSPEHSKTYIPRTFIKNPKYKRAIYEVEEVEKQKSVSPNKSVKKEQSTQTIAAPSQNTFSLQRSQSYAPGLKRTQPQMTQNQFQELRTAQTVPILPLLESRMDGELVSTSVQLELLQSRNPHDSRTLGMIKNPSFSQSRPRIPFRSFNNLEVVPETQEEGLLFEICNDANQKTLWTVSDWERLNGKKLSQIISDEY